MDVGSNTWYSFNQPPCVLHPSISSLSEENIFSQLKGVNYRRKLAVLKKSQIKYEHLLIVRKVI